MPNQIANFVLCESTGKYQARRALTESQIIKAAKQILNKHVCKGTQITASGITKDYLTTYFAGEQREVFACIFLDNQHRVLACEALFNGTIDSTAIYPREVVRRCLELNAAAAIFAHNHPSGSVKPSTADKLITKQLSEALLLIGTNTLDHVIIGGGKSFSFAERGLL